jgi:hypothetical protein
MVELARERRNSCSVSWLSRGPRIWNAVLSLRDASGCSAQSQTGSYRSLTGDIQERWPHGPLPSIGPLHITRRFTAGRHAVRHGEANCERSDARAGFEPLARLTGTQV